MTLDDLMRVINDEVEKFDFLELDQQANIRAAIAEFINEEIIGQDCPTPNDGKVDAVAESHFRRLRYMQRLKLEALCKS